MSWHLMVPRQYGVLFKLKFEGHKEGTGGSRGGMFNPAEPILGRFIGCCCCSELNDTIDLYCMVSFGRSISTAPYGAVSLVVPL